MKNNTNYFSHDCNARDDEKIMLLRSEYWWEWYGIFWLMIEKLSEATEYKLLLTNKLVISKLYQANIEVINYLFELWLLEEQGEYMYSPSLLYRMQLKLDKKLKQSEWWKKAMLSRWKNKSDIETDKLLITSKVKESKVKEIKENKSIFIKPTHTEIKDYCIERKNKVDPQRFIDYYDSIWWLVWKNKMKDWKATIRWWEVRDKNDPKKNTKEYEKKDARENFTFM